MIPTDFAFEERTKRPPRDPFNALISFGNTMMYTTVLGEIYKTQLNSTEYKKNIIDWNYENL
ncbi:CRISPR-associated endonuclease Cas1 [Rummeliibacillus sp. SL167]|uniref:CRISPR-associated endonuclease Cas1 n=1 Tax=Rummeliibacillus sp. SL167 TaxID=2579792 RepID=UPI0021078798|nr:CRISPR-associated endonuclease Cas1 [Rummeliibacillus sp. SL167]